jgi:hypothetical protein
LVTLRRYSRDGHQRRRAVWPKEPFHSGGSRSGATHRRLRADSPRHVDEEIDSFVNAGRRMAEQIRDPAFLAAMEPAPVSGSIRINVLGTFWRELGEP